MKNQGGRPLRLTNEIKEALIAGVKQGLTLKAACKCAGISYSTFANWRQKSRQRREDEEPTELDQLVACVDIEANYQQAEHRLAARTALKPRDYRHGWKNPMGDETKQKLRVKAFEQAVENVMRRREFR